MDLLYGDMLRLGASLERVPAGHKAEVGDWLMEVPQLYPDKRLRLEVRQDNAAANALYQAAGYRPLAALPGYYEDGAAGWRYGRDWSRA
mgnify:CR=1 FL=1